MKKDISVIIPFYNGNRWLERALDSVLAQNSVTVEVIVVDDGSAEPPLPALVERYRDRVIFKKIAHAGKGAAINAGAALSSCALLCILDQDDPMLPGRLAEQVSALRSAFKPDAVYSDYERRNEDGSLIDIFTSHQALPGEHLRGFASNQGLFSMQTLTLTKALFDKLDGFSTDMRLTGLDDTEFFTRLLVSGARLEYVPGVFGSWTSHAANYSKGAAFNETRLVFLEHLSALAEKNPLVKRELPLFTFNSYSMRGMFALEQNNPRAARRDLWIALQNGFSLNTLYLFFKACTTTGN